MLPVGAGVLIMSVAAIPAVLLLGADVALRQPPAWGWTAGWCLAAAGAAVWNARAGIAMMSAFDWRPLPATLVLSAGILAGWLALP